MCFRLTALLSVALCFGLRGATPWSVARDPHFVVYSHQGAPVATAALQWFERLRALALRHLPSIADDGRPVSVFGFSSSAEYEPFRLRPSADAYYVGTGDRDYIVMSTLDPGSLGTAAHEYAHLLMRRAGANFPPWLSEGLAEVFSTIRIARDRVQLGDAPPGRLGALRNGPWFPLGTLLSMPADSPLRGTRHGSEMFYAESWALTRMLLLSPEYAPRFRAFLGRIGDASASSAAVLEGTYSKPVSAIQRDLETRIQRGRTLPVVSETGPEPAGPAIETAEIPDLDIHLSLAGILLATGEIGRAESIYREAALDAPRDPQVLGGLAAIALENGKPQESHQLFEQALSNGIDDADLCYRYAVMLDRGGEAVEDRRAALVRAIAGRPDFDDARYMLALLENNLGNHQAALAQLQAMRTIAPPRTYHYWFATADALAGLGRNDDAVAAANKAAEFAADSGERLRALQLARQAQTHLAVRFVRDAAGRQHLATTRVPNQEDDFNPFIEPGDDMRRIEGNLIEVICGEPASRLVVDTGERRVTVAIPDPSRVQMRHAPPEFVCGPQEAVRVKVEYAAAKSSTADGIARGIEYPQAAK
jgi:tetratricopeptide (TPR) repeat protein